MRSASSVNSESSLADIAQPTTIREKRSRSTATYNHPSAVSTALVSVTHLVLGADAANSRLSVLGAKRPRGSLLVVGLRLCFFWALMPNCCMSRRTRLREVDIPRVRERRECGDCRTACGEPDTAAESRRQVWHLLGSAGWPSGFSSHNSHSQTPPAFDRAP